MHFHENAEKTRIKAKRKNEYQKNAKKNEDANNESIFSKIKM